jgi:hypothetical protein
MLTKDQGPRTKDQGPRTKDQGPRTKDQANAAAEAILAEANRDRIKNIPPVSWLFRCPELTALAPGQRLAVVTQAKKNVRKKPLLIAALLIWIAAHGLAWITRWDGAYHDLFQVIGLGGRVFVIILGMYLVRREARLLARNMRC